MADDIRLPGSPRAARTAPATLEGMRRKRLQTIVVRALRALGYTMVAVVAFGGVPIICAMLNDASTFTLLFSR